MKITKLSLFQVPPRWLFLKVETDAGITGWGEPIVEGRAATVAAAVKEMEHYLIGQDPHRVEDIWQVLYRSGFYRGGPVLLSAIAGIDQALWDIKGKDLGVPIYQLLGGACRDRLQVYSSFGGNTPQEYADCAKSLYDRGLRALKMNASDQMHYIDSFEKVDALLERLSAIRDALGNKVSIAVDFHGRVHKSMAKVIAQEITPYHLMFIEEPVLPQNNEALLEIARYTATPIATGERMYSRWDFKNLLQMGVVDIIQPDLSHAGGISECKKIATMAESYDVSVAPHCPLGPIALSACVQLDCCTPNVIIQEQSLGLQDPYGCSWREYTTDPTLFTYKDGYLALPQKPGLGIEIDEAVVAAAAGEEHNWKNPAWRNEDGTVAEW